MRVLLCEDEHLLAETLARGLRREGMAVDVATDGGMAMSKVELAPYDVVVLDRDLPVVHGDEVCRQLLRLPAPPRVIMLTASSGVEDRVAGLSLGADDYLGKPFSFSELVARIRALARRPPSVTPPVLERSGVRLDPSRHEVSRDGRVIPLARKELGVLEVLLEADGAVVSAEQLLERAWDENTDPFTNVVRVTLMNLRRKLGDPPVIETVIGAGYRI
jgi:DNA-binding response OmpR family regulator